MSLHAKSMRRENRDSSVCIRDTKEGTGHTVSEGMDHKSTEEGNPHCRCTEDSKKPAFGSDKYACHGIGMNTRNKTTYRAKNRANKNACDDLRCHK